jgi:hypothetical protein
MAASQNCGHDWERLYAGAWWTCTRCDKRMHPSWTPETRALFEAGCDILRLQLTPADDVVHRIAEGH